MNDPNRNAESESSAPSEELEGLDFEKIKELIGFVLRAGRRHPAVAILTFLFVTALGLTVAATMPRSFSAQVKIFAQRSSAQRGIINPNSEMDRVDDPTKNVGNMIMRHDNLVALVKQANLADRFEEALAPALRFKDRVYTWLYGPASDEDKQRALVATLEKKLDISVADDSTLAITVDWPSAQMAFDLVTAVQRNFLEARYDSDLAVINDSIAVLQEHAKLEEAKVDSAVSEYQKLIVAAALATPAPASAPPPWRPYGVPARPSAPTAPVDPSLSLSLEEVRLKIHALEGERQRLLDQLKQQLDQAELTLTPMHPTVIGLKQKIEGMSQPSAELARLKGEERTIVAQIAAAAPPSPAVDVPRVAMPLGIGQPAPAAVQAPTPQLRPGVEDGPTRLARSKLEAAIQSYEAGMARIDAANVELDIRRAAYKTRYQILSPAEVPTKPKKPVAEIVAIGSFGAAILLAFVLATIVDLLSGQVIEPWQVRRLLKLDVLGEVDRSL